MSTFSKIVRCTLITAIQPTEEHLSIRVEGGVTNQRGSALVAAHLIAAHLSAALGNAYAAPHVEQGDLNAASVHVEWGEGGDAKAASTAMRAAAEWVLAQTVETFFPSK
jgi:hypothetical protein